MTEGEINSLVERVLYGTTDPKQTEIPNCPALTTLLYRVAGNQPIIFDEATRVVELFIRKAIEVTSETGKIP